MSDPILDVDLSGWSNASPSGRRAMVDGVRRSLETGFVYTSHHISEHLLDEAYGMLAAFFALDPEVKAAYHRPASHGGTGYTGVAVETAAGAQLPDWKEMLNWRPPFPAAHPVVAAFPAQYHDPVLPEAEVPGITGVLATFNDELLALQRQFLAVVALGLGADERLFDDLLVDGATLNRAIRYPPMSDAAGHAHVWADEHADINLTTALPRASAPGLQVLTAQGWVDAAPPEGHVILNTGIMLERLSNGIIPAGRHRVVAREGQVGDRYSVVQFCHPAPWMVLTPLAACVDPDHPQRFGAIRAGDLLQRVLWEINLMGE